MVSWFVVLFLALQRTKDWLFLKLQSIGADVNQKLFRGFATTAAAREGHLEILEILLKAGACQPACEEALLEASCHGNAKLVELLMASDLIRPHLAVHSIVIACCRGFVDVVDTLMKVEHHIHEHYSTIVQQKLCKNGFNSKKKSCKR